MSDLASKVRAAPEGVVLAELGARPVQQLQNDLPPSKFELCELDGARCEQLDDLYENLKTALLLPRPSGLNWDAIDEMLEDMTWDPDLIRVLVVRHGSRVLAAEPPHQLGILIRLLTDAVRALSVPVNDDEIWDRPALRFRVLLLDDAEGLELLSARIAEGVRLDRIRRGS